VSKYINPYTGIRQVLATAEEDGLQKGIKEGIKVGEDKKEIEAVLGFYQNKIPISVIAKSLNITEEKVNKIIEQGLIQ
jgi:predicted transposase YdaD